MARNIKPLLADEFTYINSKYICELNNDKIIVSCNNFDRRTAHDIDKSFSINTSIRKFTITIDAIYYWITEFMDKGYSLIAVQNAINILTVTYQKTELEDIEKQLQREDAKVKVI